MRILNEDRPVGAFQGGHKEVQGARTRTDSHYDAMIGARHHPRRATVAEDCQRRCAREKTRWA